MSKLFGRYLRTNYKVTGKELDADAVGEAILQGSWGGGAGTKRWCGGFIMGSFASTLESGSALRISAAGAIAEYFGSSPGWSDVTGFKIFPFAIWNASAPDPAAPATVMDIFGFTTSIQTSIFTVKAARMSVFAVDGTGVAAGGTHYAGLLSNLVSIAAQSVHLVWVGWIVSAP